MKTTTDKPHREGRAGAQRRHHGLSLIELLVALPIVAMLLTATAVAIDASFKAYASAAEQASTQAATRMVTHRLLTMLRTSTAHGPLLPDGSATPPVTLVGDTIYSSYIELLDPNGDIIRVEYRAADQELWMIRDPGTPSAVAQPIIGGVTNAQFLLNRRYNNEGLLVLNRGIIDFTVQPGADATLSIEHGPPVPVRMIASTMPRKIEP
jgi:prepilin-type N-terminal cleavage/methylation domain-containing protein